MKFLGQVTDHLGVGVEISVLLIGKVGFFTYNSGSAEEDADMSVEEFIDDRYIELLEFVDIRACAGEGLMPNIVYADPDDDDVGVLCKDVIVHAQIEIVDFIAADAGAHELIIAGEIFLGQGLGHFHDESAGFCACLGDGVAEKDDFLRFADKGGQDVKEGQEGDHNCNSGQGSHGLYFFLCQTYGKMFRQPWRDAADRLVHPAMLSSARMV